MAAEPSRPRADGEAVPTLPEPIRQRVLALAAQALGALPTGDLPPPVRRFATFAPARRVKLAASVLGPFLDTDDRFRRLVAVEARRSAPDLADAVVEGKPVPTADPAEVAALAYLLRPDGWADRLAEAAEALPAGGRRDAARADDAVARLTEQLDQARTETRQVRDRLRAQIAELKAENTSLRRKLNDARQRAAAAQADADRRTAEVEAVEDRVAAARAEGERETRRLRARVAELEESEQALRRTAGQERELASVRLRLLLDTVLDAAGGLRRELALPPAGQLRPADTVDAVEPGREPVGRTGPGDDAALLDELLALPQAHLIVDGYNVTKEVWPTAPLHSQRQRLVTALGALAAQRRVEVTVVFDGAELSGPVQLSQPRGVRVRFSPPGVIADEVIRRLVRAEPPGRPVVVVSSDRELAEAVTATGARALSAAALIGRIG